MTDFTVADFELEALLTYHYDNQWYFHTERIDEILAELDRRRKVHQELVEKIRAEIARQNQSAPAPPNGQVNPSL